MARGARLRELAQDEALGRQTLMKKMSTVSSFLALWAEGLSPFPKRTGAFRLEVGSSTSFFKCMKVGCSGREVRRSLEG